MTKRVTTSSAHPAEEQSFSRVTESDQEHSTSNSFTAEEVLQENYRKKTEGFFCFVFFSLSFRAAGNRNELLVVLLMKSQELNVLNSSYVCDGE